MDKGARERCWAARDEYFACAQSNPDSAQCDAARAAFQHACPATWVKHFEQRRTWLELKAKRLREIDAMDKEVKAGRGL